MRIWLRINGGRLLIQSGRFTKPIPRNCTAPCKSRADGWKGPQFAARSHKIPCGSTNERVKSARLVRRARFVMAAGRSGIAERRPFRFPTPCRWSREGRIHVRVRLAVSRRRSVSSIGRRASDSESGPRVWRLGP